MRDARRLVAAGTPAGGRRGRVAASARRLADLLVGSCIAALLATGCSFSGDSRGGEGDVLFVREQEDRGKAIFLMSDDGRDVRRVVTGDSPRWSPDGTRFAYTTNEVRGARVWVMNPETGEKRRVASTESGRTIVALAWAPDGVRLAYAETSRIVVVNTQTGDSKPISLEILADGPLDWAPDGRKLLVSRTASVKVLDLRTGAERQVAPRLFAGDGRWSLDGERIAFNQLNSTYNPRRKAFDLPADGRLKSAIVVADGHGGSRERVTSGAFDTEPAWSSDAESIYFTRHPSIRFGEESPASDIYVVDLETRALRRLTSTAVTERSPDPRPAHRSLPDVPAPATGDIVVPELVGRHVRLENETRRFRALGLKLEAVIPPEPGWLLVVQEQVPRGGSRVPPGTVVKVYGFDLASLYATPNVGAGKPFSAATWKAHPECGAGNPRASMYWNLVRRVLRKGMPREQLLTLLGEPGRTRPATAAWPIGQLSTHPVDCIYLRVDFDRGRVTRFYQSTS